MWYAGISTTELPPPPGDCWWPKAPGVVLADAVFEWTAGTPVLHELTLQLPRGGLSLIVGQVGSGKSSILAACLEEQFRRRVGIAQRVLQVCW